jgi:hypothetical protein
METRPQEHTRRRSGSGVTLGDLLLFSHPGLEVAQRGKGRLHLFLLAPVPRQLCQSLVLEVVEGSLQVHVLLLKRAQRLALALRSRSHRVMVLTVSFDGR